MFRYDIKIGNEIHPGDYVVLRAEEEQIIVVEIESISRSYINPDIIFHATGRVRHMNTYFDEYETGERFDNDLRLWREQAYVVFN